jgi:hypothetical protein
MKRSKPSLKTTITTAAVMAVLGLAVFGRTADAAANRICSDRTLDGDYGFSVEGIVLPAPGLSFTLRGVAMTQFDGKGNLTQVDHIVFNGLPPAEEWTPGTGTYHVNADCTGTMTIETSTGDIVNLRIVVVKSGKEVRTVVTAPFNGPPRTVTSVGTRVD